MFMMETILADKQTHGTLKPNRSLKQRVPVAPLYGDLSPQKVKMKVTLLGKVFR